MSRAASDDRINEDAARWHLRMSAPVIDRADAARFDSWLTESEQHRTAYRRTVEALSELDAVVATARLSMFAEDARERLNERGSQARAIFAVAACIILCLVGMLTWAIHGRPGSQERFESPFGNRSQLTMQDGSRLSLDSRTRISATFTRDARTIRLEEGQARFRVAHDTTRPFSVIVAGQRVIATGTDFNVERLEGQSIITLLQGGVNVEPDEEEGLFQRLWPGTSPARQAVRLRPGDRLSIWDDGNAQLQTVDARSAVLWEDGKLMLSDEPLGTAVERFNRFNGQTLVLDDPGLRQIRISGLFSVSHPAVFATAVSQLFMLSKSRKTDGSIHLSWARQEK